MICHVVIALSLFSCTSNIPDEKRNESATHKDILSMNPDSNNTWISRVFSNGTGYGYEIIKDGRVFISQPFIPAVQGNISFSTSEKASKAAALIVFKLQHNQLPPTVTKEELDSLGVLN